MESVNELAQIMKDLSVLVIDQVCITTLYYVIQEDSSKARLIMSLSLIPGYNC